jgi:hypothetical protein
VKKMIKWLFVLAFVLGGWALAAASLHVVRAPGKMIYDYVPLNVQFVTKNTLSFHDTWVDTTKWTEADVAAHPSFKNRLEQAGKLALIEQAMMTPGPDTKLSAVPPSSSISVETSKSIEAKPADPAPSAPSTPAAPKPKSIFDFSGAKK